MSQSGVRRGRFAPSPTGLMHLGNARSALLGWLQMRAVGGDFLLRIEDLDPARSRPEFTQRLFDDLTWLGLDWNGPVLVQSERGAVYQRALDHLRAQQRLYPCTCSRADIARAASAPHVGEEGPRYPGTCAGPTGATQPGRPESMRFRVQPGRVDFTDALHGAQSQDVLDEVGDFIVRRADGVASYQLAVVVDDAESGITDVLRGDDLLSSTARQLQLYQALGATAPRWAHVPLLIGDDGRRLAKRDGLNTVAGLREAGLSSDAVVGLLAKWSGLSDGSPTPARALVDGFSLAQVQRTPVVVTDDLARLPVAPGAASDRRP